MICIQCKSENPGDKKFCRECGAKLVVICSRCGSECSPEDNFCGECGQNLNLPPTESSKPLSSEQKLELVRRYLPGDLIQKILAHKDKMEGERKQVTVMFCDMEGFTALSEELGPENAYSVMNRVYEILIRGVHEYEGTVNEMTGDGIMALFGAPVALEDAPQRAIRSAYDIHRAISKFSEQCLHDSTIRIPMKMRVGIHTGPVVVGSLGNDYRVEFKAVGETVNLASRMESMAEPGSTYVTEDTFKLTEGIFRFEALGERKVKGKKESVRIYRVIGPSTRRTRFDISAERGLTFFVGRERELELMMDGFERSRTGRGQAFFITAEAGIGKSRLLYEFRKALVHEDVTFLEGKCLSYSRNVAYHPVIDVLKASFEVSGRDSDSDIRNKVNEGLAELGVDEAPMLPYILELLSVEDSGIEDISLSPEVKKVRIIDAVNRVLLKQSELRTLILAIEDLHWIDRSSEEALKVLLVSISGARILLLCTYRPEFVPSWKSRSYHCQLNLNRLSNREGLVMVSHLLGTDDFDENIENFILERTEGNPFFIEEFVKSLKDLRVIEKRNNAYFAVKDLQDVAIPSTIQDVIMARVDSLLEEAKKLLQTGSVIGREFSHKLIKEVVELPEKELLSHLSVLKDSELIYERGIYPELTYIFKHALTQDAAYQSLLESTRQRYHHAVAEALEERFPGTAVTQPELLGYHFTEAGIPGKAITYWQKAGEMAVRRTAYTIAVGHFKNGLALIEKIPDAPQRDQLELNLQTSLGNTLMTIQGYGSPEVKPTLDRARELCQKVGKTPQLFQVLHGLWIFYIAQGETQTSHELAEQCLDLAKRIEDHAYLLEAHHALGSNFLWRGDYLSALKHFEEGIELYDSQPVGSHVLPPGREDPGVIHKSHAAHMQWILGYPDRALQTIQTAHDLVRELQHPFSRVFALFSDALVSLFRGEMKRTLEQVEPAVDISEKQGFGFFLAWSKLYLGSALVALGKTEKGISQLREGIDLCVQAGVLLVPIHAQVLLAEAFGNMGKIREGLAELTEAEVMMERTGGRFYEEELHRIRGELLLLQEVPDEQGAEAAFQRALEVARRKKAKSLELRAAISLSKLWHKQGKGEEARRLLSEVYGWFTEGFDTVDLRGAKALLDELE